MDDLEADGMIAVSIIIVSIFWGLLWFADRVFGLGIF